MKRMYKRKRKREIRKKIPVKKFLPLLAVLSMIFPVFHAEAQAAGEATSVEKTMPSFDLTGKKILFVITSSDILGKSKEKTGYWLEEVAAPYEVLSKAGAEITLASPKGGLPPVDAFSLRKRFLSDYTKEFKKDQKAQKALASTIPLDQVKAEDYDALYYPAGFGIFSDLVNNPTSINLIESFSRAKKPMAFLCQAPAVLKNVKTAQGHEIVRGLNVTALRNSEEAGGAMLRPYVWLVPPGMEALGNDLTYKREKLPEKEFLEKMDLKDKIPFLVETMLKQEGANYEAKPNMASFTVTDVTADKGFLITGQNPYSAAEIAEKLASVMQ
ncbi:type 1 glutamine amidotransferase domain-containing protein [Acetobacteraceae bacterium]|nr:type 1 glutamine amidotransferase domain-containing protein [Acetobacteraceae bacterium]